MRKLKSLRYLPILLVIPSLLLVAFAHPGRTDSNGGHTNHSTGEYHYHHGYSAHDHYDMDGDGDIDCPYDFDDKTGTNSGTGNDDRIQETTKISFFERLITAVEIFVTTIIIVFSIMAIISKVLDLFGIVFSENFLFYSFLLVSVVALIWRFFIIV